MRDKLQLSRPALSRLEQGLFLFCLSKTQERTPLRAGADGVFAKLRHASPFESLTQSKLLACFQINKLPRRGLPSGPGLTASSQSSDMPRPSSPSRNPNYWIASRSINCPGEDSNLHTLRHQILNLACLPFHHLGTINQTNLLRKTLKVNR